VLHLRIITPPELTATVLQELAHRGHHQQPGAGRRRHDRPTRYGPMAGLSVAVVNRAAGPAGRSFRALALGNPSEAGKSLSILLVNLAGLLGGGVLTLLGTRVWGRRIEAGQAIIRPKPKPGR
jgi:hypothetical protein